MHNSLCGLVWECSFKPVCWLHIYRRHASDRPSAVVILTLLSILCFPMWDQWVSFCKLDITGSPVGCCHWSRNGMVPNRLQAISWTIDSTVRICMYAAPGLNSLGPSDAIWLRRSGSTLAQVMACCLMAPSHYLNQCWLISKVWWH